MQGPLRRLLLLLSFCLVVAAFAGCTTLNMAVARMTGQETTDVVPGVSSPAERIATLRKIGKKAARAKPEEQERLSGQLAAAYHEEEDPMTRAEIVRALSGYPTAAASDVLRAALADPDAEVRIAACHAWGKRGGPEAVTLLQGMLGRDIDGDVRLAAVRALGQTGDSAAAACLGDALGDRDPAMQYLAVTSLEQVTGKDFGGDVNRWRQYVRGELPEPDDPVSMVERFRQMF